MQWLLEWNIAAAYGSNSKKVFKHIHSSKSPSFQGTADKLRALLNPCLLEKRTALTSFWQEVKNIFNNHWGKLILVECNLVRNLTGSINKDLLCIC